MKTIFVAIKVSDNTIINNRLLDIIAERIFREHNPEMNSVAASSDPEVIVDWASDKSYIDKKQINDKDWVCIAMCDNPEDTIEVTPKDSCEEPLDFN